MEYNVLDNAFNKSIFNSEEFKRDMESFYEAMNNLNDATKKNKIFNKELLRPLSRKELEQFEYFKTGKGREYFGYGTWIGYEDYNIAFRKYLIDHGLQKFEFFKFNKLYKEFSSKNTKFKVDYFVMDNLDYFGFYSKNEVILFFVFMEYIFNKSYKKEAV